MSELANEAGHVGEEDQAASRKQRTPELPPGKLDVIYIGGIPPLRQIWTDFKAIVKARRESPPRE